MARGRVRPERESLRGFAKRVGVWPQAVRCAIASVRLERSIARTPDGTLFIWSVRLALEEWVMNADGAKVRE
jgi:hypothetical protein